MGATCYDDIAEWYAEWVAGPMDEDPYFQEVRALMGEVAGERVCDLACGEGRKVGAYHRTLSTSINALTDAGLALERMREPRAADSLAERSPAWAEVPAVLVAWCRKGAAGAGS
jgi:hypothetical protein